MALIYVPCSLVLWRSARLELVNSIVTPGQTGSGVMPIVSMDGGGLWGMEFGDIQLRSTELRKAWRAISGACGGGVNKLIVPYCDSETPPWPLDEEGDPITSYGSLPHSDDTLFDDGSGYYQPVIDASSVGAAELFDTEIVIAFVYGGPLVGGEHFSIDHPTERHRIYRVTGVEINDDGNSVVSFVPPLREDVPDGTPLDFDEPKCVMQPVTANSLDITLDIVKFARPSVQLIEAPVS